ncbi:hypothetical protein OCU04_007435 [Sclerotinia nivalis]|uniref:Uncharacterized protein n=1 Tax=Sclerotinia nivalis TaxID=352851 RepID=A0A9X0AJT8_9HELO|nr:hypothetical protein OCU04_007435 [Sclerotinia nivalis]
MSENITFQEQNASTNPGFESFPENIRMEFKDMINGIDYKSKERLEPYVWYKMKVYLEDPTLKASNQAERNIKFAANQKYELQNGRLFRKAYGRYPARYAVPNNEAFDIIKSAHLRLNHCGRDKLYYEVSVTITQQFRQNKKPKRRRSHFESSA